MGNSYFVPRSVKGESRILYIFTIKSFVYTLVAGAVGFVFFQLVSIITGLSGIVPTIIFVGIFALIGYGIGALRIPDSPLMGKFRKAGGEELSNIIFRTITFNFRRKVYLYNYDRENNISSEMKKEGKDIKESKGGK